MIEFFFKFFNDTWNISESVKNAWNATNGNKSFDEKNKELIKKRMTKYRNRGFIINGYNGEYGDYDTVILNECNICYETKKLTKCYTCIFEVCEDCSSKLNSNKCPHCKKNF